MILLKRILVPTDFSEPSQAALRYARALAEAFKAEMTILHVLEDPFLYAPVSEGYVPPANFYEDMRRAAEERLSELLAGDQQQELPVTRIIRQGDPFVEIVRYAKESESDLIVVGTHGRGAIAHILLGSVAERVVRKAPCPVLTVREKQHEFVMP